MALSVLYPCQSIIAAEINKNSVAYFSDSINDLIDTYDTDEEYVSEKKSSQQFIKDRLIVSSDKVNNDYGAIDKVVGLGYTILQYDSEESAENAKNTLISNGYNAEYDAILSCCDVNSNSSTSAKWGNDRVESQETLNAIKASGRELSEVTVGVIDTGVDDTHPDLADRVVETGLNFSSSGQADSSMDDQGHGTMVSGIIAQNTTDYVKIKPYKVLNSDGKCATTQIISVVNYILSEKNAPDVINLSLGGESDRNDPFESTQRSLIQSLVGKGITVVVAAGNESSDAKNYSPANINNVITVSASTSKNLKATYSNYGGVVDIAAPGDSIFTYTIGGGYTNSYSGTSFAAPFVTAAAATVLMLDNTLSPTQVESKIKNAAFPIVNNTSGVEWCGAGILNYTALFEGNLAPEPVFSRKSGAYNEAFSLEITVPEGYTVMYTTDNSVPTLNNGTEYTEPIETTDSMSFVAVAINENHKSRYIPLNYSIIYLADESDFTITDAGAIGGYTGEKTSIIVPDTINGITPVSIASTAFEKSNLKVIILPDTVTKTGRSSFGQCSSLTKIVANGMTTIGPYTFSECTSLTDVDMPNVLTVQGYAFSKCKKLEAVNFNETVEDIYNYAFEASGMKYAYFPNIYYLDYTFEDSPLISIDCPLVYEITSAFKNCYSLEFVNLPSLTEISNCAFQNCNKLTEFDFSNITYLGKNALSYSNFRDISLPNLIELNGTGCFSYCNAETISIPQIEILKEYTFRGAKNLKHIDMPNYIDCEAVAVSYKVLRVFEDNYSLEELYIPNAVYIPCFAFSDESSVDILISQAKQMQLKYIYAPKAVNVEEVFGDRLLLGFCANLEFAYLPSLSAELDGLPCSNAKLYFSDKVSFLNINWQEGSWGYLINCNPQIIAPTNSNANLLADKYNFTFIPSDSRDAENDKKDDTKDINVRAYGKSIRVTNAGLRFGFSWNEIPEIEALATDIEYGFIYHYNYDNEPYASSILTIDNVGTDNIKRKTAVNVDDTDEHKTTFNLVFTNIPKANYNTNISVRAYVCIDGMYFYSNTLNGSFSHVAELVLVDEEIDQNTKNAVNKLLEA